MKSLEATAKVFGRGVGRTFLQKGFPTTSDVLVRNKMPPGRIRLSTLKVDINSFTIQELIGRPCWLAPILFGTNFANDNMINCIFFCPERA